MKKIATAVHCVFLSPAQSFFLSALCAGNTSQQCLGTFYPSWQYYCPLSHGTVSSQWLNPVSSVAGYCCFYPQPLPYCSGWFGRRRLISSYLSFLQDTDVASFVLHGRGSVTSR